MQLLSLLMYIMPLRPHHYYSALLRFAVLGNDTSLGSIHISPLYVLHYTARPWLPLDLGYKATGTTYMAVGKQPDNHTHLTIVQCAMHA